MLPGKKGIMLAKKMQSLLYCVYDKKRWVDMMKSSEDKR